MYKSHQSDVVINNIYPIHVRSYASHLRIVSKLWNIFGFDVRWDMWRKRRKKKNKFANSCITITHCRRCQIWFGFTINYFFFSIEIVHACSFCSPSRMWSGTARCIFPSWSFVRTCEFAIRHRFVSLARSRFALGDNNIQLLAHAIPLRLWFHFIYLNRQKQHQLRK